MKYETQNTGIENMRYDFMPVGSIVPFASDIIPLGWLLCDGAPIERSRYPELYDLIGDKLPDHRGMFLRGNDNGRGLDAGRVLGSYQVDLANVETSAMNRDSITQLTFKNTSDGSDSLINKDIIFITSLGHGVTGETNVGSVSQTTIELKQDETRPKNNSVNYIIKALHIANPSMEYQVADGLNHKIETNLIEMREAELNNTGVHIGYNGIKYIQDTGDKVAGKLYYDKLQPGLFYCEANTSATVNSDTYFTDYSNYANGNKLQNLETETSFTDYAHNLKVAKKGNIVTCSIDSAAFLHGKTNGYTLYSLPTEYRPKELLYWSISTPTGDPTSIPIWIHPDGKMSIEGLGKPVVLGAYYGTITYSV